MLHRRQTLSIHCWISSGVANELWTLKEINKESNRPMRGVRHPVHAWWWQHMPAKREVMGTRSQWRSPPCVSCAVVEKKNHTHQIKDGSTHVPRSPSVLTPPHGPFCGEQIGKKGKKCSHSSTLQLDSEGESCGEWENMARKKKKKKTKEEESEWTWTQLSCNTFSLSNWCPTPEAVLYIGLCSPVYVCVSHDMVLPDRYFSTGSCPSVVVLLKRGLASPAVDLSVSSLVLEVIVLLMTRNCSPKLMTKSRDVFCSVLIWSGS